MRVCKQEGRFVLLGRKDAFKGLSRGRSHSEKKTIPDGLKGVTATEAMKFWVNLNRHPVGDNRRMGAQGRGTAEFLGSCKGESKLRGLRPHRIVQ